MSVLVGQPDVTLDKLHKISNFHLDKKATSTQAKDTKADPRKDLAYTVSGNFVVIFFFKTKDDWNDANHETILRTNYI